MAVEGGRSRQISELQSDAAGVVAQAEQGPVEIRRYSEPVAYLESVDQHGSSAPGLDHVVHVAALGGDVGVREARPVLGDQLRSPLVRHRSLL